jgi:sarcosine oxidase/L-pipecolate oxidase
MPEKSYLLIGAGCFGASTALHLKRTYPAAQVTLVDRFPFPCPTAAANDLNKIVRAEYEDPLYLKLALEALKVWNCDPIFKPWFHRAGVVFASDAARGEAVSENYKSLNGHSPIIMLDPEDMDSHFGGIFRDSDWSGVSKCTWSPQSGWADAEQALQSVVEAAIDLGVKYITATISTVSFDKQGNCFGAQTKTGERFVADHTVLCTGAYTAQLLAESAPHRKDIQVNGRMVAAGACMGIFKVSKDQMRKFHDAPVVVFPDSAYPGKHTDQTIYHSSSTKLF